MFNLQSLLRSRNSLDPSLLQDQPNQAYPDIASTGSPTGDDSTSSPSPLESTPTTPISTSTPITAPSNNLSDMNAQSSQPTPSSTPTKAPYNFADTYKDIQNQQPAPNSAQAKYRDFLDNNLPNKDDYSPSKTQRVAAMLSGFSAGVKGKDGYDTAQGVLDEPYNEAMGSYKLQGDKLAKASDLEEKDINNRVKTFRDVEEANSKRDTLDRQNKLADSQIANTQSEIKAREYDMGQKGWQFTTDKTSGHRIATKINPNSPNGFDVLDMGKYELNPDENITNAAKKAGAVSDATLGNDLKKVAARGDQTRQNIDKRFNNSEALIQFKKDNPNYQFKDVPGKGIVAFNPSDPTDFKVTGVDTGKLTDTQKIDLGLKAKKDLKATPSPPKTTTSTVVGNTRTTTTSSGGAGGPVNNTPPPAGAKPGGKWIQLPSGASVYQEPGDD